MHLLTSLFISILLSLSLSLSVSLSLCFFLSDYFFFHAPILSVLFTVINIIFQSRHISPGEELTMDYYSITTSDIEWRAAICLCGQSTCRGSFLHYATQDDLQQVLNQNCGPLWRYKTFIIYLTSIFYVHMFISFTFIVLRFSFHFRLHILSLRMLKVRFTTTCMRQSAFV